MLYDRIGREYATRRIADPRIAAQVLSALGDADSVLNVGAGAGSYEPTDRRVIAIEPSMTMIRQRPVEGAPTVQAAAERLPVRDQAVDAALAILTVHHWKDRSAGLAELRRVARDRVVILTWDPDGPQFWLTQRYFPAVLARDVLAFPSVNEIAGALGPVRVATVPVPSDCVDGFLGAYRCRPHSYLDPSVRASISGFWGIEGLSEGLCRLEKDLASGEWARLFGGLREQSHLDIGYRLVIASLQ